MNWELYVDIVRFVDDAFPGFVECRFTDADGRAHLIVDKIPLFTEKYLWVDSEYPQAGSTSCQILSRSKNGAGEDLVQIVIAQEDADARSEFVVFASQICNDPLS